LFVPYFGTISVQSGANIRRPLPNKKAATGTDHSVPTPSSKTHAVSKSGNQPQRQATFGQDDFGISGNYTDYLWTMPGQGQLNAGDQAILHPELESVYNSSPEDLRPLTDISSDWDKMMFGSELDQDWNYGMPDIKATM